MSDLKEIQSKIKKLSGKQALKAGMGYTIGNYLLKGIGFITVPLFARLMTQEDFGYYNTFMAYEGILYLFISLALHVSLKNARYDYKDSLDKYTSSISLIPILMLGIFFIVFNIFPVLANRIFDLDRLQMNMLLVYCYSSGMLIYYQNRLALDYKYKEYLKLSYLNTFINLSFSIGLMLTVFSSARYMARIVGSVVALFVILVYILIRLWKKARPQVCLEYWKYGLKLSIPIIPHGIGQVVLLSFDRIMISRYVGAKEAGIYSFAYTIFTIVQITANSISTVFEPWAYKELNGGNEDRLKIRATQFYYLMCGISVAVIAIAPELILLLGSKKYANSIYCVIPVLVGGFFSMAYTIPSVLTYYYKKTQYIALGTAGAAILNVILNAVFIKKYGYIAAAYTTLVCYVLYFAYHYFVAYKVSGIRLIKVTHVFLGSMVLMLTSVLTFLTLKMPYVRYGTVAVAILIAIFLFVKHKGGSINDIFRG